MDKPKLRPLNAVPVSHDGQELVCLYDATGLADKQIVVDPQTFFILTRFDGEHTIEEIKLAYTRQFGELLLGDQLEQIVEQLDEAMLLQSERLERHMAARLDAYRRGGVRQPAHAGDGYPADPEELREQVRSFFAMADGPGKPEPAAEPPAVRVLVAPHIDFGRGARGYAHAYKALVEAAPADTYIILGIAHQPTSTPYAVTRNRFATPLGDVEVDTDLVEAMQADYPGDLAADEVVHLSEHSVELHVVMLKALFEDRPFRIVPLLAASFDEFITDEASPMALPQVEAMVRSLKGALALDEKRVCLIAAVDLAHVGNQFGDPGELSGAAQGAIETADREMLATLERGDAEGFMALVRADGGRRKICGVPALYTAVCAIDGASGDAPSPGDASSGRLLHYEQAFTPETQSLVSFAAMVFR